MLMCGRGYISVAVFVVTSTVMLTYGEQFGLYKESDLLEILDSSNFNNKVVGSNVAYVIEFYNAFCGHCIRFSIPWKEFGLQVYGNTLFVKHCTQFK